MVVCFYGFLTFLLISIDYSVIWKSCVFMTMHRAKDQANALIKQTKLEPKKIAINLSKTSISFGGFHFSKHPYDQTIMMKTLHVLRFFQWFLHDYVFSFSHKTRMHHWSWMPRSSCMYSWKMSEPLLHHYLWSQCWM